MHRSEIRPLRPRSKRNFASQPRDPRLALNFASPDLQDLLPVKTVEKRDDEVCCWFSFLVVGEEGHLLESREDPRRAEVVDRIDGGHVGERWGVTDESDPDSS